MMKLATILAAAALLAGCAARQPEYDLSRTTFGQPQMRGADLDRAMARAAAYPLGSNDNPVRAEMPQGQRAYLGRLRCGNGQAPRFSRIGNVGPGVYRNIVDAYDVDCGAAAPGRVKIYMDMYHPGHVESRAVPGFTIVPGGLPYTT